MNLNDLIKQKKITKVLLASRLGITREYLYTLLDGDISDDWIKKIAVVLDEPYDTIFNVLKKDLLMKPQRKVFSILPFEEWRIVKQIIVNGELPFSEWNDKNIRRDVDLGYFLYERPISKDYKISDANEDGTPLSYIDYYKSENYPHDYVDEKLLEIVKSSYPNSRVNCYTVLTNSEREFIDNLQQPPSKNITIRLMPTVPFDKLNERGYYYLLQNLKLYASLSSSFIENISGFSGFFELDKEDEVFNTIDTEGKVLKFL
ncbi:MAG: hypothetical protein ACK5KT_11530 [Dysgonomonas sp.]